MGLLALVSAGIDTIARLGTSMMAFNQHRIATTQSKLAKISVQRDEASQKIALDRMVIIGVYIGDRSRDGAQG